MPVRPEFKAAWNDNTVRTVDTPETLLVASYRWIRQQNYKWKSEWKGAMPAKLAIDYARASVAVNKRRYPTIKNYPAVLWQDAPKPHDATGTWSNPFPRKGDRLAHVENPQNAGLRFVGRVVSDCGGRKGIWGNSESSGWFIDLDMDTANLCYGVVYQLTGRDGKARFVAGYQFGGVDGGPTLDLGTIYEDEKRGFFSQHDDSTDHDAAITAARAADSMAEIAAEKEREYQTAWRAGSDWAECQSEIEAARNEFYQLNNERRAALKQVDGKTPTICKLITNTLSELVDSIQAARLKMQGLAKGDSENLSFYPDARLKGAFCEGAGLSEFPA